MLDENSKQKHGELARRLNSTVNGVSPRGWSGGLKVHMFSHNRPEHGCMTGTQKGIFFPGQLLASDMAGLHGDAEGPGFHPRLSAVLCGVCTVSMSVL